MVASFRRIPTMMNWHGNVTSVRYSEWLKTWGTCVKFYGPGEIGKIVPVFHITKRTLNETCHYKNYSRDSTWFVFRALLLNGLSKPREKRWYLTCKHLNHIIMYSRSWFSVLGFRIMKLLTFHFTFSKACYMWLNSGLSCNYTCAIMHSFL